MNTTKKNLVHPQTVEVPQPLEIHPSIDPTLASEMLRVADLFSVEPKRFDGSAAYIHSDGCGCILAYATGLTGDSEHGIQYSLSEALHRWPAHRSAFVSIFGLSFTETRAEGIARIEHFLRTGE